MPRELFRSDAESSIGRARRWRTLPAVGLTYGVIIGAAVVVPLMALDLSRVRTRIVFATGAPLPVEVPPAPRPPQVRSSIAAVATVATGAPTIAPDTVASATEATTPPVIGVSGGVGLVATGASGVTLPGPPPAVPEAVTNATVRVGGHIREPRKVRDVRPHYPAVARAARVEGLVILEATIARDGAVTNLRILRSVPMLDEAALAAVRDWRYTPTMLNGQPVEVVMTVTVRFALQ